MKALSSVFIRTLSSNWGWTTGVLATLIYIKPFGSREFYVNGDGLYFIWTGLIQGENLLGFSQHLAWPEGFSSWQYPQLGLGYLLIGTIASVITGSNSASAIFGFSVVIIAMINGISVNLLLRSINSNFPYLRNCLTFSLTFAPFLIANSYHLTVGAFYPLVLSLYLYFNLTESKQPLKLGWRGCLLLFILLTGIPWWQGSVALIFAAMALAALLMKSWVLLRASILVTLINFLGFILQTLPSFFFFESNSLTTRSGWDSNHFGGHFADFLFASPFINRIFPEFARRIEPGISNEFNSSGLLGLIGFTVLLLTLIIGREAKYSQLGLIVVLFFTLGAFGNLQAAFAEMIGIKTPLRTWSRLVIALAIIGIIILYIKLQKRILVGSIFGTLIALFTVLDVLSINPVWEHDLSQEKRVIRELQQETEGNCAVLQVPMNSWPNPYVDEEGNTDETMYSSAIFYTLDSSFYWTYGNWTLGDTSRKNSNMRIIEEGLRSEDPFEYLNQFYCAILVDNSILKNASELDEGKDIELARYIQTLPEVRVGSRYSLVILKRNEVRSNFSD